MADVAVVRERVSCPQVAELAGLDLRRKTSDGELAGACPGCGGRDRFVLFADGRGWMCRTCRPGGGDVFDLWRLLHGGEFADAVAALSDRSGKQSAAPYVTSTREWSIPDSANSVAVHVRDDLSDGSKRVHWRLPDGTKGLGGRSSKSLPLYAPLPITGESTHILIGEGEPAVDAAVESLDGDAGIVCLGTVTGAAATPDDDVLRPIALAGYTIVLGPDNDVSGQRHMQRIAERLRALGATNVRRLDLGPLPPGGDVVDFLAASGTGADLRRRIETAAPWEPEIGKRQASAEPPGADQRRRFVIRSMTEAMALPPPEFRVDGVIPDGGLVSIHGEPESLKSFATLDILLCVAAGIPWAGRQVRQGPTLLIVGEGASGIGKRVRAWCTAHPDADIASAYLLTVMPALLDAADVDELLAEIRLLPNMPVMIALDTFARALLGGDENSARDMGIAIAALDRIRRETGAALFLPHHLTKATGILRGSGALLGALDAAIRATRDGDQLTLSCAKQKDLDHFKNISFKTRAVILADGESSLVLDYVGADTPARPSPLTPNEAVALRSLAGFSELGGRAGEWERASGLARNSLIRARDRLITLGFVARRDLDRYTTFALTDAGRAEGTRHKEVPNPVGTMPGFAPPVGTTHQSARCHDGATPGEAENPHTDASSEPSSPSCQTGSKSVPTPIGTGGSVVGAMDPLI